MRVLLLPKVPYPTSGPIAGASRDFKDRQKETSRQLPAALKNATLGPAGPPQCTTYFCLMGQMRATQCLTPGSAAVVVGSHRSAR